MGYGNNQKKKIVSVCSMTSEQANYGFKRLLDYVAYVAKNQRERGVVDDTVGPPITRKTRKWAIALLDACRPMQSNGERYGPVYTTQIEPNSVVKKQLNARIMEVKNIKNPLCPDYASGYLDGLKTAHSIFMEQEGVSNGGKR